MLLGLGLATWMEFYTYDGVNLVLPDMAGTFGLSQDQASWILTTYLSALLYGVPLSIWMAGRVGYLRYIVASPPASPSPRSAAPWRQISALSWSGARSRASRAPD
jgi:MFS family permease